jgi:alpha/beta hydrolase family protein
MPITAITVSDIASFAEGYEFGTAGGYVRIRGTAYGTVDPHAPENAGIVDLDKASRNAEALVEYATDFDMLRPNEPRRGSGILVYDVTNRGSKRIFNLLDDVPANDPARSNDPKTREDAGLGFCLGRGYSIVWSGWDPGAPRANHGLGAEFPTAIEAGRPMVRRIRDEFHIGTRAPGDGSQHRLPYPAAAIDENTARLTVRDREADARVEIPAGEWEFVDSRTIRLLPEGRKFEPFRIYDFWYQATNAKVLGIGFASVRDLVSFLRYERADNPLLAEGTDIRHALGFGVSQSGRFLRHFLELGMNKDSASRRVFDGVFSHVAGAGKVFANHRFGMPGRTATQHEDRLYPENWFPFGNMPATDPVSGKTGAILRGEPTDPLVIETNSSTEYWQKGASLVHTDPAGRADAELPANVRVYLIAGTQHGGRPGVDPRPGPCLNPRNPHSATPALRALFYALEAWVAKGVEPPPSRVPRLADGTAVKAETLRLPRVKGFALAPGANRILPPVDWIDPPETEPPQAYETYVSAVDSDGNEIVGIRLPPIAVPLGTYTGWNVYKAQPGELADRDGSFIAFAVTKAEREAVDDLRPALEERYGSLAAYAAQVRAAAEALVTDHLLLPADAEAFIKAAEECDRF